MDEINELRAAVDDVDGHYADEAVSVLIGVYRHAKGLISELDDVASKARQEISDIIEETGQTKWKTKNGSCTVTKPTILVRYDSKGLDYLRESNPELRELLDKYRTETERAGTLMIRGK